MSGTTIMGIGIATVGAVALVGFGIAAGSAASPGTGHYVGIVAGAVCVVAGAALAIYSVAAGIRQ